MTAADQFDMTESRDALTIRWPTRASQAHLSTYQRGHWPILYRTCAYLVVSLAFLAWIAGWENLPLVSMVSVVMLLFIIPLTFNEPDGVVTTFDLRNHRVEQVRGWFELRYKHEVIPFQRIKGLFLFARHGKDGTWSHAPVIRLADGANKGLGSLVHLDAEAAEPMIERLAQLTGLPRLATEQVLGHEIHDRLVVRGARAAAGALCRS